MRVKAAEFGFALGLFVLVSALSHTVQRPITLNGGLAWDGQAYHAVADQLAQGRRPTAAAPFVYRLGTPALVAMIFPNDVRHGFARVNLAGSFVATILLVCWLRLYLTDWRIRVTLVSLFLVTWHAPVRFLHYYPAYADPWLFALLLAGLISVRRVDTSGTTSRVLVVGLVTVVGVVFREAALLIPVALLAVRPGAAVAVLGAGMIALIGIVSMVEPTGDYSFARAAASSGYQKSLAGYVHAWFIAFGPMLVLPVVFWRDAWDFLRGNRALLVFLIAVAGLAWVGGTDTERIAYWSMPVGYLLVGRVLESHPRITQGPSLGLALLVAAQLVSARAFWVLPDVPSAAPTPLPFLTVPANDFQFLDLYTTHGDKTILVVSFAGYLLVAGAAAWWLRRQTLSPRM